MKKIIITVAALVLGSAISAAAANPVMQQAQALFKPIPKAAPALDHNPVTPEKIELGKMLFFEPRLSRSGRPGRRRRRGPGARLEAHKVSFDLPFVGDSAEARRQKSFALASADNARRAGPRAPAKGLWSGTVRVSRAKGAPGKQASPFRRR